MRQKKSKFQLHRQWRAYLANDLDLQSGVILQVAFQMARFWPQSWRNVNYFDFLIKQK